MAFVCFSFHEKEEPNCNYHKPPLYYAGKRNEFPDETVWIPDPQGNAHGLSVGPCESCKRTRPCLVNG
jgi:hypothetical protein